VADPQREAAAGVCIVEERVPCQRAALDDGVETLEKPLGPIRDVGVEGRHFRRLLLFDRPLPRRGLRGLLFRLFARRRLRRCRRRESDGQRDHRGQFRYSRVAHA
jgi:hypothetical protein